MILLNTFLLKLIFLNCLLELNKIFFRKLYNFKILLLPKFKVFLKNINFLTFFLILCILINLFLFNFNNKFNSRVLNFKSEILVILNLILLNLLAIICLI